ncbi:MAG: GTPase ObgE [Ruminococcaceae bacterium]|nr:GTPase ObgE [Oscillospiraceae bacterium]
MLVDIVKIHVKAGRGGDGAVSFHREKYISAGGPDGGDGGRGGDIVFVADTHMRSLMDFRYTRKYTAQDGSNGAGGRCYGRDGKDTVIKVPVGTLIREGTTGQLMCDMSADKPFIVAKGGRGGWGNSHFATSTRQAPRFAKPGLEGEEYDLILELKLLADVGLIGYPNVGKSTLLSVISAAKPKIANYHFTTLEPNLGVVEVDRENSFICADIPGLIEGAKDGAGLGHHFLRHIERCRVLVHVVDVSGFEGRDPIEDFETINAELSGYSERLAELPQIVAANKSDIVQDQEAKQRFLDYIEAKGLPVFEISAATRQGVQPLVYAASQKLEELPEVVTFEPDFVPPEKNYSKETEIRVEDGVYIVEGDWLIRAMSSINFGDLESRLHFEKILEKEGIFDRLAEMGIPERATVNIYGLEFEYVY